MILLDMALKTMVNQGLALLPPAMDSDAARVMMLAIGLQESKFSFRYQQVPGKPYDKGPARGFWQNERGEVFCLMTNDKTKLHLQALCLARKTPFDQVIIHTSLEYDDVLAAGCARLILWADPKPLPPIDCDHETAWQYYLHNWRPGKPHRETWDQYHIEARSQVLS